LDGASEPEAIVTRAHQLGYPAIALTDRCDLGGAVRFAYAAREIGIQGIIGAEISLEVRGQRSGVRGRDETSDPRPLTSDLVLLAQSREGYGNISALITRSRMDPACRGHLCPDGFAERVGAATHSRRRRGRRL
jgi:error-prone DNA polymerase